jgi:hypothetical protein
LTTVVGRGIDSTIEWRTYTPDGRVLTVRQTESGWAASCNGEEHEGVDLTGVLRDAVGHDRGEALRLHAHSHRQIEQWVVEQAARIEREADG